MTDAAGTAREVAKSRPVKYGARIGLVAYGITYLLIAWLALQVAFGSSGERTDQNGAFQTIASEPFGQVLLWVLVVGFVAVALWRLEQAIFATGGVQDQSEADQEAGRERGPGRGLRGARDHRRPGRRLGAGGQGTGQEAAAGVLGWPGGQFLVGAVGLVLVAIAVVKAKHGWEKKFLEEMNLPSDQHARQVVERLGQVGSIAKAVALGPDRRAGGGRGRAVRPVEGERARPRAQGAGGPAVRDVPAGDRGASGSPPTACSASSTPSTTGCSGTRNSRTSARLADVTPGRLG